MGGSQIYLEPGEEMTFEDMLIAIAVGSANDACVAVAEHLEGTHKNFVERMNKKARLLGLKKYPLCKFPCGYLKKTIILLQAIWRSLPVML